MYLAVVLDAFSRRVIGWALGRTLEAELAVAALRMALIERQPPPGLVHHSDRGVQYASQDYTEMLKQHQATISMSRKGNPYDNAACESFMKTLKYEEVYRNEYRDFHEARASIGEFLERVYNQKRLHSALGYVPPAEFENGAHAMRSLRASYETGALPLRPRDLTQLRQNGCFTTGRLTPPRPFRPLSRRSGRIPALPYPPLRCFQSGSTATSPCNDFSANGDNPLNFVSHSRGSLHPLSLSHHRTYGSVYGGSASLVIGRQSISEARASRNRHWAVQTRGPGCSPALHGP